jgi:hypothetical protein
MNNEIGILIIILLIAMFVSIQHSFYKLNKIGFKMGKVSEEVVILAGKLDVATTAIAAELESLKQELIDGTVTLDELDGAFNPLIDKLTALASNPEDPVPDVPVEG